MLIFQYRSIINRITYNPIYIYTILEDDMGEL